MEDSVFSDAEADAAGLFFFLKLLRGFVSRIDATDNTWEGTWDSALEPDGAYYMCNYHIPIDSEPRALYHRRCGLLRCGKHTLKEIVSFYEIYFLQLHF